MKRCIFFDRDGVINQSPGPGYVERWRDFYLLPAFIESLRVVYERGYVAVVITNQRGVARGIMSMERVDEIHGNLRAVLKDEYDLELLDIYCCPHNNNECDCRKPKPGMLLQAAEEHGIDLSASWMVGDSVTDIEAGHAAGCKTIYIGGKDALAREDYRVGSMKELPELLKKVL